MIEEVKKYLDNCSWRYAKTMPQVPHWYTLKGEDNYHNNETFEMVVQYIRDYGYDDFYYRKKYRAYNYNGYKYWTMGAPVEETTVINRKKLNGSISYDTIAENYDDTFSQPKYLLENQRVMDLLEYDGEGSVLDIGCGTGLLLDYHLVHNYLGIDPSEKMLEKLEDKHAFKRETNGSIITLVHDKYENWESNQKFDYIISLFGSPSYIPFKDISKVKSKLKKGGKLFLMFFKPGYCPVIYEQSQTFVPFYPYKKIPYCKEYTFNNYKINVFENI